jgi:phosphatidylglycerophosphate synthase
LAVGVTAHRAAVADGSAAPVRPLGTAGAVVLLALVLAAECSAMLDGWAARRAGTASELGGLLDPLCDSLARLTMFFAAALAGWVWIGVPLTMAGRDIIVAYVRVVAGRTGGRTSARLSGKVKAVVQGAAIVAIVVLASRWAAPAGGAASAGAAPWLRAGIAAAVIVVTLWSLADYLRGGWGQIRKLYGPHGRAGRV